MRQIMRQIAPFKKYFLLEYVALAMCSQDQETTNFLKMIPRTLNMNLRSGAYLAHMMTSCNPVRSTRSSHKVNLLVVPHQKSNKYSEKAFAVVGPRLWNELLTDELRGCNSVDTFKKKLKTMLFKKHY